MQADRQRLQRNDPDAGTEHAIAPLKSGILAALMAVFDLGAGVYETVKTQRGWKLCVETGHVRRAHAFLRLLRVVPDRLSQIASVPIADSHEELPEASQMQELEYGEGAHLFSRVVANECWA